MKAHFTFFEFFAGGGMARAGLGPGWSCMFANDFDDMKVETYKSNYGEAPLCRDIALVTTDLLPGCADLAWASFPCQDLSLAGGYRGLGRHADMLPTRSGTFWPFWSLMRRLVSEGRGPRSIVLENVYGAVTSQGGRDFAAIASALSDIGYRFGALVIDAKLFVPQSRPRLFIVAVRDDVGIPNTLIASGPTPLWHPVGLKAAVEALPSNLRSNWVWWRLPAPRKRKKVFADLIENHPNDVTWDSPEETRRLLSMMSDTNRAKVDEAQHAGRRMIGGVYKRTRTHDGVKVQRAEVRFDDISGCLRTPSGGSSRQRILVVDGAIIRSRLLSAREAALLMGLPKRYKLPPRYNDAYHVAGDGVVVPVVRHLVRHLVEPSLSTPRMLQAAE